MAPPGPPAPWQFVSPDGKLDVHPILIKLAIGCAIARQRWNIHRLVTNIYGSFGKTIISLHAGVYFYFWLFSYF